MASFGSVVFKTASFRRSVSFIKVCIMMRHRFVCISAVLRIEILFNYSVLPLSHIIVIQLNWRYFQKILSEFAVVTAQL